MPLPGALPILAKQHGMSIEAMVTGTINRVGTIKGAADELGVSRQTLLFWLKAHGWQFERLDGWRGRVVKAP